MERTLIDMISKVYPHSQILNYFYS